MIITRDGKTYTLTENELSAAHFEQQHIWDTEDIINYFKDIHEEEPDNEMARDLCDPLIAGEVAFRYRKYLNDYDDGDRRYACMVDAYDFCCRREL